MQVLLIVLVMPNWGVDKWPLSSLIKAFIGTIDTTANESLLYQVLVVIVLLKTYFKIFVKTMFKRQFLFSAVCLFLFTLVLTEKAKNFDPFPNCTKQQDSKETKAKLAKCPRAKFPANNSDPAICCKFWEMKDCQRDVYFAIPECKSARFLLELTDDAIKSYTCTPAASCLNVTTNVEVETTYENIFHPLEVVFEKLLKNETYENCSNHTEVGAFSCSVPFQGLMDGTPSEKDLCCDQWNFKSCLQTVTEKEPTCAAAKPEFDSVYKTIETNIAKKCPANKFHCLKSSAINVSVTISLFGLSFIVALIMGNA